jgi:hypothetical protein
MLNTRLQRWQGVKGEPSIAGTEPAGNFPRNRPLFLLALAMMTCIPFPSNGLAFDEVRHDPLLPGNRQSSLGNQ